MEIKEVAEDALPVDGVDLGVGEGLDELLERLNRLEVAAGVHEHLAVVEARRVVDGPRGVGDAVALRVEVEDDELRERLEGVHRAEDGLGGDRRLAARRHAQRVALVRLELQLAAGVDDVDLDAAQASAGAGGEGGVRGRVREGVLAEAPEGADEVLRGGGGGDAEGGARCDADVLLARAELLRVRPDRREVADGRRGRGLRVVLLDVEIDRRRRLASVFTGR